MGQHGLPRHVAYRVNGGLGRAALCVDGDKAFLVNHHAGVLEPHAGGIGSTPHGHEDLVKRGRGLMFAFKAHGDALGGFVQCGDPCFEVNGLKLFPQPGREHAHKGGIGAGQEGRHHLDHADT